MIAGGVVLKWIKVVLQKKPQLRVFYREKMLERNHF